MTEQQARRIVRAFNVIQYGSQSPNYGEQAFTDARHIIEDYNQRKWTTTFTGAMEQAKIAFILRVNQETEARQ